GDDRGARWRPASLPRVACSAADRAPPAADASDFGACSTAAGLPRAGRDGMPPGAGSAPSSAASGRRPAPHGARDVRGLDAALVAAGVRAVGPRSTDSGSTGSGRAGPPVAPFLRLLAQQT